MRKKRKVRVTQGKKSQEGQNSQNIATMFLLKLMFRCLEFKVTVRNSYAFVNLCALL